MTTTPTAAERRLAALAPELLLQGEPHTALVRAEVNRRRAPGQSG